MNNSENTDMKEKQLQAELQAKLSQAKELLEYCEKEKLLDTDDLVSHTDNVLEYTIRLIDDYNKKLIDDYNKNLSSEYTPSEYTPIEEKQLQKIVFAAVLHDIGKSQIVKDAVDDNKKKHHPKNAQKYIRDKEQEIHKHLKEKYDLSKEDIKEIGIMVGSHKEGTPIEKNGKSIKDPSEQLEQLIIGCEIVCCADKFVHIEEALKKIDKSWEKISHVKSSVLFNVAKKIFKTQINKSQIKMFEASTED